jgi:hypothetical protein
MLKMYNCFALAALCLLAIILHNPWSEGQRPNGGMLALLNLASGT